MQNDEDLDAVFATAKETFGKLDFLVHSIAYAPLDDLKGPVYNVSRDGFKLSMDISAYSLIAMAGRAKSLMPAGGSILTLTYLGGEKVIPGYNVMGVCKAALESSDWNTWPTNSARTTFASTPSAPDRSRRWLASAVGDFDQMMKLYESFAPLRRNITPKKSAMRPLYLLSDSPAASPAKRCTSTAATTSWAPRRATRNSADPRLAATRSLRSRRSASETLRVAANR